MPIHLPGWRTRVRVLLLWGTLLVSRLAWAADYYVNDASTAGDVAFPGCAVMGAGANVVTCGSCAQPCLTLQYSYNQLPLAAGDTVHINTGRYLGTSSAPILTLNNPAKAGTDTNWLTFEGPMGADGRAAVDGAQVPLALLDGATLANAGVFIQVNGIRVLSLGITNLSNVSCSGNPLCGSAVRIVESNLITSFEMRGLDVYALRAPQGNALDVDQETTTCVRCVVENNFIHSPGPASAAMYFAGMGGMVVRGNTIDQWGGASAGSPVVHVMGAGSAGMVFENNVITNSPGSAIRVESCVATWPCGSTPPANVRVFNNTFRLNTTGYAAATVAFVNGTGHQLRNNIIHTARGQAVDSFGSGLSANYNGYYLTGSATLARANSTNYNTLTAWQGTGRDANSMVADPLFVSTTDSHLQSPGGHFDAFGVFSSDAALSPFVDRGDPAADFSGERAPHGGRVDLGAYGNTLQNSLTPSLYTLSAVSGDAQQTTEGTALAQPFVARLTLTSSGSPAAGLELSCTVLSGGGTCSPAMIQTNAQGEVSMVGTLGPAGENRFSIRESPSQGLGAVEFTATALPFIPEEEPDGGTGTDGGVVPESGEEPGVGVNPELETPPSLLDYRVGCGCDLSSSPSGGWLTALVLLAVAAARRF